MKKPQPVIKSGFYNKYAEAQKRKKNIPDGEQKNVIIVNKQRENPLQTLFNAFGAVFRIIIYILLFLLSSVGLTALINLETRDLLIQYFGGMF